MASSADSIKHFQSVIKAHRGQHARNLRMWNEDLRHYRGEFWGERQDPDEEGTEVQWPYTYAFTDVLISNIVPPNPACNIKARRKALIPTADVRTQLCNDVFDKDNLTWKLWRAATLASIMPQAFLKAVWSKKRKRPRFRVVPATRIWFDTDAEEWDDIKYIVEVLPVTRAEFKSRCKSKGRGRDPKAKYDMRHIEATEKLFAAFPTWVEQDDVDKQSGDDRDASRHAYKYAVIYEVYDFVAKKFYHIMEGYDEPLLSGDLPYPTLENPYYRIAFNDGLMGLTSFSDASMVREPMTRLNQLATLDYEHTLASLPRPVVNEALLDDPEEFYAAWRRWKGPETVIPLNGLSKQTRIEEVVQYLVAQPINPDFVRKQGSIQELIEFILALPTYSRGQVGQADVATELALVDTAQKTRNARRQKVVYDTIEWAASAAIRLFGLYLTGDEETRIYLKLNGGEEKVADLSTLGLEAEDNPWDFDYTAHPYNAAEDNSTVMLKKIQAFVEVLLSGDPNIDRSGVIREILKGLNMSHLYKEAEPVAPAPGGLPPAGQPAPGELPLVPGAPPEAAPLLQGGNLPAGGEDLQAPLPDASGGQLAIK